MPTANHQTTDRAFLATISVGCTSAACGQPCRHRPQARNRGMTKTPDFGRSMSLPSSCHDERAASASCRDLLESLPRSRGVPRQR